MSTQLRFDAKEGINNLLLGRLYTTQLIVNFIPLLAILVRKLGQPLNKSTPGQDHWTHPHCSHKEPIQESKPLWHPYPATTSSHVSPITQLRLKTTLKLPPRHPAVQAYLKTPNMKIRCEFYGEHLVLPMGHPPVLHVHCWGPETQQRTPSIQEAFVNATRIAKK